MRDKTTRGAKEGIGFGIIAGVIFAMMEIIAAGLMGNPPLTPLRMFASVAIGQGAMEAPLGTVIVIGGLAHLVLSAGFGLIYGLVNAQLSPHTETSWGRQVGLGVVFGVAIWFVNFQIIARLVYPWFLTAPQGLQAMMHAVFFGLPLALMYAAGERRAQHLRGLRGHA